MLPCHFLTTVWGDWHTNAFIDFNLPSLLASGNLPSFCERRPASFDIFIRASDEAKLKAAPVFHALRQVMPVRLFVKPDGAFAGDPIETHVALWHEGVERVRATGGYVATNAPDLVWADGSFAHLADRLDAGQRAIYLMGTRGVSETLIPVLRSSAYMRDGALSVRPSALVRLMLDHMHPLEAAYVRDGTHFPFHPEFIVWPVSDEGILVRALAASISCFDARLEIGYGLTLMRVEHQEDIGVVDDSEQMFNISLAPVLKDLPWYFSRRRANVEDIANWWMDYEAPAHTLLARHPIRFHGETMTPSLWRQAEQRSAFFIEQLVSAREMIRVARLLSGFGLTRGAQGLTTSLYGDRLRRFWPWPGPVTVFCPTDASLAGERLEQSLASLLAPERSLELRRLLQAHVVLGQVYVGQTDEGVVDRADPPPMLRTLAGTELVVSRGANGGATIAGRPVRPLYRSPGPDDHWIYAVDGLLPV